MKKYKIQYTKTIHSKPEYMELTGTSKSKVQSKFWSVNPTFFITNTSEIK